MRVAARWQLLLCLKGIHDRVQLIKIFALLVDAPQVLLESGRGAELKRHQICLRSSWNERYRFNEWGSFASLIAASVSSLGIETGKGKPRCSSTCFKNSRIASVVEMPRSTKIRSADFLSLGSTRAWIICVFTLCRRMFSIVSHLRPRDRRMPTAPSAPRRFAFP